MDTPEPGTGTTADLRALRLSNNPDQALALVNGLDWEASTDTGLLNECRAVFRLAKRWPEAIAATERIMRLQPAMAPEKRVWNLEQLGFFLLHCARFDDAYRELAAAWELITRNGYAPSRQFIITFAKALVRASPSCSDADAHYAWLVPQMPEDRRLSISWSDLKYRISQSAGTVPATDAPPDAPSAMEWHQLSNSTNPQRHELLLTALRDSGLAAGPATGKILSFGCSTGDECLDLHAVFPLARIFGCDVNETCVATATEKCRGVATIFPSSPDGLAAHGPFDLIVAFNVLCRYPDTYDADDISTIYPFTLFDAGIGRIDHHLRDGGILGLFNSPYFLEDASCAATYTALPVEVALGNGWMDKCLPSGRRAGVCRFTYDGGLLRPHELIAALRSDPSRSFSDLGFMLIQERIAGSGERGDFRHVFWRKRA